MNKLAGSELSRPPASDEVELSVFGPGVGESIVLHLTGGVWITVDSCLDNETGTPVALRYFEQIGVVLDTDVRFVIATHWHDDHVGGIGTLFEACKSSQFVCPYGLQERHFTALLDLYKNIPGPVGSGIDEFRKVIRVLAGRRKAGTVVGPEFAGAGTIIFEQRANISVLIKALAPSSPAVAAIAAKFAENLLPSPGQRRSRIPSLDQNDLALAITVKIDDVRILLGADLEEDGREGIGWTEVVNRFGDIDDSHEGMKVPHHGSITGHCPAVWTKLLVAKPWSVVTPYVRIKSPLPTQDDLHRLKALSSSLFLTAKSGLRSVMPRESVVRKQLQEMNVKLIEERRQHGHVRLRRKVNGPEQEWTFELFGDAALVQ